MDATISPVETADLPFIAALVNSAYRGDEAKKGWTHEADLIEGDLRTDMHSLQQALDNPAATILAYRENGKISGCVYLEKLNGILYLGMLSVQPDIQSKGIGKKLLQAAEIHAREQHCSIIQMTVISVRHELINWYRRQGYEPTGETRPFHDDGRFGQPRRQLEFIVMEKKLEVVQ